MMDSTQALDEHASAGPAANLEDSGGGIERIVGWGASIAAAGLLAAAFVFLSISVAARYLLDQPIYWADEFSTFLLTWIGMLGIVVAAYRSEHMRMTFAVERLPRKIGRSIALLVDVLSIVLYAALTVCVLQYAAHESTVPSPGLEVSMLWKLAALPIGFFLLTLLQVLTVARVHGTRSALIGAALAVAAIALLSEFRGVVPAFEALPLAASFFLATVCLVLLGAPIAVVFSGISVIYLTFATNFPLTIVGSRVEEGISNYQLLAIPLFVFLGAVVDASGVARALVNFLALVLHRLRGDMSYVLLGSTYVVSGISGSQAADMAAVAPALFPEMKRRGMDGGELVSLLSAAGAMSLPVPPSLVMIAIGSVCGVSIAAMFAAGFFPAAVSLLALCAVVWWRERKRSSVSRSKSDFTWKRLVISGAWATPVILLVLMIRGAVVSGVATATEVSTIAVCISVLLGLTVYRSFSWRHLGPGLISTVSLTGAIIFIIGAATIMSWILAQSGLSTMIVKSMTGVPGGIWSFMALSILVFIVLGSVLEGIPAIVLLGPLLFPVARQLGINDVHYAMVMMLAMGIGLFLPPIGVGFYAACAIGKVEPSAAIGKTWAPMLALFIALLIVAGIPQISTFAIK